MSIKRKLIDLRTIQNYYNESANVAENELMLAEDIISRNLNVDKAVLYCFDKENAIYKIDETNFIKANYIMNNGKLVLENIEELVVNEDSLIQERRNIIGEFLDCLTEGKSEKEAKKKFAKAVALTKPVKKDKKKMSKKYMDKKEDGDDDKKKVLSMKERMKKGLPPFDKKNKKAKSKMENMINVAANILEYCDFVKFGPVVGQSEIKRDTKGHIVEMALPDSNSRKTVMAMNMEYKNHDNEIKVLKNDALKLPNDSGFIKNAMYLKRQNNADDHGALEEALDHFVASFPQVLFLNKDELSKVLEEALRNGNANNFDTRTCDFMSEAILINAHNTYEDRVQKLFNLVGAENDGKFESFQYVMSKINERLNESYDSERQMAKDLFDTIKEIHELALRRNNEALKFKCEEYLGEFNDVLNRRTLLDYETAEDAAKFVAKFIETNLETSAWNVSANTHTTITGDHPDMAKHSKHSYSPFNDFSGDYGVGPLALDDEGGEYKSGKGRETLRNKGWGNLGGNDVYPSLKNPYVPADEEGTMPFQKGADKESGFALYHDDLTYPDLKNPYLPKSMIPLVNDPNRVPQG